MFCVLSLSACAVTVSVLSEQRCSTLRALTVCAVTVTVTVCSLFLYGLTACFTLTTSVSKALTRARRAGLVSVSQLGFRL